MDLWKFGVKIQISSVISLGNLLRLLANNIAKIIFTYLLIYLCKWKLKLTFVLIQGCNKFIIIDTIIH